MTLILSLELSWGAELINPNPDYTIEVWQVDEGLPQISVTSLAQSAEGYLWVGTFNGLARFDGERFVVFDEGNTPELGSSRITQVRTDPQDGLWIVTEMGGLARMVEGRWTGYGPAQGLPPERVRLLVRDTDDRPYLIDRSGGLHRIDHDRIWPAKGEVGLGLSRQPQLLLDGNGQCWIGREGKANLGSRDPLPIPRKDQGALTELYVLCATRCRAGGYWLGTTSGVYRLESGQLQAALAPFPEPLGGLHSMVEDDQGHLLLGTWNQGVLRWKPAEPWQPLQVGTESVDLNRQVFLRDREGNLWIGTGSRGLYKLKPRLFRMYDTRDGLPANNVSSVCVDRAGRAWIGLNGGGVNYWEAGRIVHLQEPARLRRHPLVYSVLADRSDGLWIGLYSRGVLRLHAGEVTAYTVEEGYLQATSWALFEDRSGAIWLGGDCGLRRYQGGRFTLYTQQDGLADNATRALAEDRSGTLYVGTGGGLNLLRQGQFTVYTEKDGLADNHIAALCVDREDTVWIGTVNGGLGRFKQGRFAKVTVRDGLPSNAIGNVLEDNAGELWLGSSRGIVRLQRRLLNAYLEGRRHDLPCQVFNQSDGLNTIACTGGGQPGSWKGPDGRLWFSTVKGLAVVNPNVLPHNPLPPPVVIEEVTLDDQVHDLQRPATAASPPPSEPSAASAKGSASAGAFPRPSGASRSQTFIVPPRTQRVEFRYTGLSLTAPEKVKFRYRLEHLDQDWIEAGFRRTAHYTRLPPGQYVFVVTACNNDGVWNNEGARIAVTVLPSWWQTWWFRAAVILSAAGMVIWAVEARLRQLKRKQLMQQAFSRRLLESQEAERKRIAGELHDSLGQDLLVIKNRALLGMRHPMITVPAVEQLDEISKLASHTLEEIREISRNLRPYQLDHLGLTKTLQSMVNGISRTSGIPIAVEVDSVNGLLPPPLEIHFYRIVQELLNNLVKHSQAATARVSVKHEALRMILTVEDDGCGFAAIPRGQSPAWQGLGLTGIAERVRLLGGTWQCDSRPTAGTRWTIEIPIVTKRLP